jgi:RNA ligase
MPMNIQNLDHLRTNPMIRFKTEKVDETLVEIVTYMIGDKELWDDPAALETRGNVYDVHTGECICACFPKFFNVGERDDTQPDLVKDSIVEVFEKRDGSMITPVMINNKLYWKTKKSFCSDVANLAQSLVSETVDMFAKECIQRGYTPIFEFTHPDNRIVLDYGNQPNFTLIAARNMASGDFLGWLHLEHLAEEFHIPMVKAYSKTWTELTYDIENAVGIEGYVLVLEDGRRVKLKTKWYMDLHHTMTELRERDVVEAVLNETVDDMKSLLTSQGKDLTPIEEIERYVAEELTTLQKQVNYIVWSNSGKTVKEVALEMKDHPLFSLIMSEVRGKEANYVEHWRRNRLRDFSLRCVYNFNF